MTDSNTASGTGKLPLTLSNLLVGGEPRLEVISSTWACVNLDHSIYPFCSNEDLFWEFNKHLEDGYIYLMWAKGTNYYKIGKSKHPDKRLRQVSPKMPFETELVGALPSKFMSLQERMLHFDHAEFRRNGEWFSFDDGKAESLRRLFISRERQFLENKIGEIIFNFVGEDITPWVHKNFEVSTSLGNYAGYFNLACEIGSANAAIHTAHKTANRLNQWRRDRA